MCPAQGYDTVTPMRLQPAAPRSRVKHSTTELITAMLLFSGIIHNSGIMPTSTQYVAPLS